MRLALGLFALMLLNPVTYAQTYYWRDSSRVWYPDVTTCSVPWRQVLVKPQAPVPNVSPPATYPQVIPYASAAGTPKLPPHEGSPSTCTNSLPEGETTFQAVSICGREISAPPGSDVLIGGWSRANGTGLCAGLVVASTRETTAEYVYGKGISIRLTGTYDGATYILRDNEGSTYTFQSDGSATFVGRSGQLHGYFARLRGSADNRLVPAESRAASGLGPSFDCSATVRPLGKLICSTPGLPDLDLRFVQTYQSLRQQIGEQGQLALRKEAAEFDALVVQQCGIPDKGPAAGSPECVRKEYNDQRLKWLARLTGAALEEANRPLEQHIALQRQLQELGYLPAAVKLTGVYGDDTRKAISAFQKARGIPENGLLSDSDARLLERAVTEEKTRREREEERAAKQAREEAEAATKERERRDELLASLSNVRDVIQQKLSSVGDKVLRTQGEDLLGKLAAINQNTPNEDLNDLSRSADDLMRRFNEIDEFGKVSAIATMQVLRLKDDLKDVVTDAPYFTEIQSAISAVEKSQQSGILSDLQSALGNLNQVHEHYRSQIERDRFGRF